MRSKLPAYLILGVAFLTWAVVTPAFGGTPLHSEQEMQAIQPGKGVPLTDAQLDAIRGGEPGLCMREGQGEECTAKNRGRSTDIIFWDEWVNKGLHQASGASPGGFGQSNTIGTLQINSTVGR